MHTRALLISLAILLYGCGNSLEETRKTLQGTWIAAAYLDSLESSGSTLQAFRGLTGISDFHYDPSRDSAVFGFRGGRSVGAKGLVVLERGDLQFTGDSLTIAFAGPRGADRMRIGDVELRRVSHVADITLSEYIVRRMLAGSYTFVSPRDPAAVRRVNVSYGGGVEGLGDIVSLSPVTDYSRSFPQTDAIALETLFQPETLFYSWRSAGDTLFARWMQSPGNPRHVPPALPGESFLLLRQRQ